METIGLIAAMPQESAALLRLVEGWKRIGVGKLDCKAFELHEHNCLLVTSGMGMRRASEATRYLIENHSPRLLISFGIAGAVEADLDIGDVVMPEAYCKLEHGVPGTLQPLSPWPDKAIAAAAIFTGKRGVRLVTGTAVTTGDSQVMVDKLIELKHPVLEMETAGIAPVAAEKGIPFLSIRAISDGPRAPVPFDLSEIMDEDANLRVRKALAVLAQHPTILLTISRLMRNSKLAAENAAMVLADALGSLDIMTCTMSSR